MNIFNIIILIISAICVKISFVMQIQRAKRYNNGVNNLRRAFMVNLFIFFVYLIKLIIDATIFQEPVFGVFNSILLLVMSLSVFLFYQENNFSIFTKEYWRCRREKKRV